MPEPCHDFDTVGRASGNQTNLLQLYPKIWLVQTATPQVGTPEKKVTWIKIVCMTVCVDTAIMTNNEPILVQILNHYHYTIDQIGADISL